MRLLTKEWYQIMTDSGLGVCLTADERAAVSSEEVYQTIRAEKLESWLLDRKALCEVTGEPFDPNEGERLFGEYMAQELEHFRTRTPPAILSKVADIRVLALGYCTEAVFEALKAYRAKCEEWTQRTMEEAWNMQKAQGISWIRDHSLHDSVVLALDRAGEDLLIEFERDDGGSWPEIKVIRFHDARILKQEQPIENAWWLYDEVWKIDDGCEVHALLWRDGDVFELTILCRETELVWTT